MGVKFKDIVSFQEIKFEDLKGKVVAVDAANSIYQFLSSIRQRDGTPLMDYKGRITSHLSGILYRTSSLVEKGIKPIYVFDGESHVLKSNTRVKRSEIRKESEKKWKEALEEGEIEEARKYAVRSSRMSAEVIESSKKLLDFMGIPYIQATGEGEAQASYMVQNGDAWCVASQDYDCILFGSPRMVRNLAVAGTRANLELIELKNILAKLDLSREQLVDVAILVGTDFNDGIKGIGAKKGLKLIKEHGDLLNALKHLEIEMEVDPELIRDIFLKPDIISDYKLKWKKPDKEKIIDFLCMEHSFSEDRVVGAVGKLKKLDSTQKSLEEWF
ncbi:MAG: flap endonuclease-1 [Euryarchaeota archaeon]|nr:flap endonuclease-1 [Euryarchaeota archaeon]